MPSDGLFEALGVLRQAGLARSRSFTSFQGWSVRRAPVCQSIFGATGTGERAVSKRGACGANQKRRL